MTGESPVTVTVSCSEPTVSDALIRANIRVKEGDFFTSTSVNDDVKSLLATGYFHNVKVVREPTARAQGGELGQRCDRDAPTLVVREVKVQDVQFVERHHVQEIEHRANVGEVARDVEEDAAVGEAGCV